MKKPKIVFKISINKEIENCLSFIKRNIKENPQYVEWFLPDELHYVLKGKIDRTKINKILKEYTQNTFRVNNKKIKENVKKAEKEWKIIEKRYFSLVSKIFKNHPWPKGKYIGFASIFTMYPRNIQSKTFFFPGIIYSKKTPPAITVIGHEVLHFMFFSYIKKKYGLNTGSRIKGKEGKYLWKISEVFNSVIESWKPYHQIFKFKTPPYTGKNYYKKMRRQWAINPDIDRLLDNWLKA
ncbi:MAG: hypothetical protein Q8N61_00885 [bacterium]|nr:hypothetical protein [bacterium]